MEKVCEICHQKDSEVPIIEDGQICVKCARKLGQDKS